MQCWTGTFADRLGHPATKWVLMTLFHCLEPEQWRILWCSTNAPPPGDLKDQDGRGFTDQPTGITPSSAGTYLYGEGITTRVVSFATWRLRKVRLSKTPL